MYIHIYIYIYIYIYINFDRQNQRKWLRADEEKKQKIPRKNNHRRQLP